MKKYEGCLIACDLDGTLLSPDGTISDENVKALNGYMENGGLFAFASGRCPYNLRVCLERVAPNVPCICYNGGMIYDFSSDTVLETKPLPGSAKFVLSELMRDAPECDYVVETMDTFNFCSDGEGIDEIKCIVPHMKMRYASSADSITDEWLKIDFWARPEKSAEFEKYLKGVALPDGLRYVRTHEWALEILPSDADKGYALESLKKLCKNVRFTVSLGDNDNDVVMLKNADVAFVPSNAADRVLMSGAIRLPFSCGESFAAKAVSEIDEYL